MAKAKKAAPKPRSKKVIMPLPPKRSLPQKMHDWLARNARVLSLIGGTVAVSLWTVIRHITNGVNFDVVGQVGLAQQWANGQISGVQLGATNYLLKIPIYFIANQVQVLSPMQRLLVLALLFNIVTFLLLFILFEKFCILYNTKQRGWLYLALGWLAVIAGNVFWIDYANSRNLEVVGGVLFVYLVSKFIHQRHLLLLPVIAITGSLVFFADTLQLYVCGVGVCAYVVGRFGLQRTRSAAVTALSVLLVTAVSYAGSRELFSLATRYLHVSFYAPPTTKPALSNVLDLLQGVGSSTLKIFGANFIKTPFTLSSVREVLNAVMLLLAAWLVVQAFLKARLRVAAGLMVLLMTLNYLVYVASGQVMSWETSRYLIMAPVFMVLAVSVLGGTEQNTRRQRRLRYSWLALLLVSGSMLCGALAVSWPSRHQKDAHIYTQVSYLQSHQYRYAIGSREFGVTTSYFAGDSAVALPFGCESNHMISPTNLFYDNAVFKGLYDYTGEVPVVLQQSGITFGPNTCSKQDIVRQLGVPKREEPVPGVGMALVYDAASLHITGIDALIGHPRPETKASIAQIAAASTLQPLEGCTEGIVDTVVAHPDDDILFMNPDLYDRITSGACIRTVYTTAADDGRPEGYWRNRERGIEAAYAVMAGVDNVWSDAPVLIDGHTVLSRTLTARPSINLVFLRLPDGGVGGEGFSQTGHASLQALARHEERTVTTVDHTSNYNYAAVTRVIRTVIYKDKPTAIFTHIPGGKLSDGDHSDHAAVGRLTIRAATMARSTASISTFIGYPMNNMPDNLTPEEAAQKRAIFDAYAMDDAVICSTDQPCTIDSTYGNYFMRRYRIDAPPRAKKIPTTIVHTTRPAPTQRDILSDLFRK